MGKEKIPTNMTGVITLTRKTIGFVAIKNFEQDILIPTNNLNTALNGDTVEISLYPKTSSDRLRGSVLKVVERARTSFIGVVEHERGLCFVKPDDKKMYSDILIPEYEAAELETGTKVFVSIAHWENPKQNPIGKIEKILGKHGTHEVEMHAIVLEYGFSLTFSDEVELTARRIETAITNDELALRRDCRGIPTCTIDPKNAQDFDDALSYQELKDGSLEIGVHIADVTHYVRPGDELDVEAQKRATSVYLVDRTIPMLPEKLSNEVCSLKPNVDRLAFSAIFTFTKDGTVKERWFGETVIHSNKRFSYEEAQTIIDSREGTLSKELLALNALAKGIREERMKKGAIDFDQDEVEFELDAAGTPLRIVKKERLDAHKLIEEFMLLANKEVAEYFYKKCSSKSGKDLAFVYRIHDMPNPDKIDELVIFLKALGHETQMHGENISAHDINELFKKIEGTPEENLIKTATIRSMAKAVYSTKNIGHFGLAFKYYTHFTSPIRRYPDVMVHRILKKYLKEDNIPDDVFSQYEKLAIRSSQREIEAVQAERASIKYKQVEYMVGHVGETFTAVISGVVEWGIYVEELETKAEGLIRMSSLGDDFYTLDKKNYSITGERRKRKLALGDTVKVLLTAADLDSRTLDFTLAK